MVEQCHELGCTVGLIVQAPSNGQMHASTCVDALSETVRATQEDGCRFILGCYMSVNIDQQQGWRSLAATTLQFVSLSAMEDAILAPVQSANSKDYGERVCL